ncbi:nucleolar protein,Nop52-domain-containing protein [Desarmillaria tabescens]|uniref:Nucleolar protein,Nop52-domain-containing protein n=1 Tax=Armillaria tabescens TaxID=1929756 RepID=A0AA39NH83_ARMTA|nr:nucleolar protein,Nop52-domain-containing protein [Desarmillaria tabescens]KAK0465595.1 nucleolar protein,Nop52-domain-containing protein [Desarmillaria tabescens]
MAGSSSSPPVPPLGKYLASTDKKVRDKAIKNLSVFLSDSKDALPPPEMARLWKGIFYCFWMSDKPLIQQALATELAELVLTITSTPAALSFLSGFWETMVREWNGMDRFRLDKYYMLVRRFVNAAFRLLMRAGWDKTACDQYNTILTREGGPLCPSDIKVPTSLTYHLSDVYIEELDKAVASFDSSPSVPPAPLDTLLSPFLILAAQTSSGVTYKRIKTALLDPLLSALPSSTNSDGPPQAKRIRLESKDPESYPNLIANACMSPEDHGQMDGLMLRKKLLRRIFEVASESSTRGSNRRRMYEIWKDAGDGNYDDDSD